MTDNLFKFPAFSVEGSEKSLIPVLVLDPKKFERWETQLNDSVRRQVEQSGFSAKAGETCVLRDKDGQILSALSGLEGTISVYTLCPLVEKLKKDFSNAFINDVTFEIQSDHSPEDLTKLAIGWGWACYQYDAYKKSKVPTPVLLLPPQCDGARVKAFVEGVSLIRNLVNTPSNDLGTEELAKAASHIAKTFDAKFSKISGEDLVKKNFPMIYAVGKGSSRPPAFVEFTWGNKEHPVVTLVGKGIVFDTGGLNIKPGQYMRLMKKDMGGSAHALGLSWIIMSLKLPVRLRVILAIAENSISGDSFRPGDVIQSRKGLTVEIADTDAEGRLVIGDALAAACEEKNDLIVDFCTLTGSARSALGYDIPALFSNRAELLDPIKNSGMNNDDPVWPMPLWAGYEKDINTDIADVCNDGKGVAGAIYGALFLNRFVDPATPWVHLDLYAWEQTGKPGRPAGGADTGMRAIFHFLEQRYKAA